MLSLCPGVTHLEVVEWSAWLGWFDEWSHLRPRLVAQAETLECLTILKLGDTYSPENEEPVLLPKLASLSLHGINWRYHDVLFFVHAPNLRFLSLSTRGPGSPPSDPSIYFQICPSLQHLKISMMIERCEFVEGVATLINACQDVGCALDLTLSFELPEGHPEALGLAAATPLLRKLKLCVNQLRTMDALRASEPLHGSFGGEASVFSHLGRLKLTNKDRPYRLQSERDSPRERRAGYMWKNFTNFLEFYSFPVLDVIDLGGCVLTDPHIASLAAALAGGKAPSLTELHVILEPSEEGDGAGLASAAGAGLE